MEYNKALKLVKCCRTICHKILVPQASTQGLATFILVNETVTIPIPQPQKQVDTFAYCIILRLVSKTGFMPTENGVWSILNSRLWLGVWAGTSQKHVTVQIIEFQTCSRRLFNVLIKMQPEGNELWHCVVWLLPKDLFLPMIRVSFQWKKRYKKGTIINT